MQEGVTLVRREGVVEVELLLGKGISPELVGYQGHRTPATTDVGNTEAIPSLPTLGQNDGEYLDGDGVDRRKNIVGRGSDEEAVPHLTQPPISCRRREGSGRIRGIVDLRVVNPGPLVRGLVC